MTFKSIYILEKDFEMAAQAESSIRMVEETLK